MTIEKVDISKAEASYQENWCRRCDKSFCVDCVDFHMVDFDIEEDVLEGRGIANAMVSWKGENVCPWCYNQLADKKNKES